MGREGGVTPLARIKIRENPSPGPSRRVEWGEPRG